MHPEDREEPLLRSCSSWTCIPSTTATWEAAPPATMPDATWSPARIGRARHPTGINKVFQSETQFGLIGYRTQLFGPSDMHNVKKIQAGYKVQTLSQFLEAACAARRPGDRFPAVQQGRHEDAVPEVPELRPAVLPPNDAEEKAAAGQVRRRSASRRANRSILTSSRKRKRRSEALGVKEGYDAIVNKKDNIGKNVNGWLVGSAFGDRAFFHGDWLLRAAAALAGIYGN